MSTANVHLSDGTHRTLQTLSQQTGRAISEILEKAVEEYRRKVFLAGVDQDFATLKADPAAWAEELEERTLLENTLMDGLEPEDEPWDNPAGSETKKCS